MSILSHIKKKPLILDGAMGTAIQKSKQLSEGILPETLNLSNPDLIKNIHLDFLLAGSDALTTNTFGANPLKFSKKELQKVICEGIRISKNATKEYAKSSKSKEKKYVIHGLGPSGKLMKPAFELSFDEAYNIYKEQIRIAVCHGVDAHLFETFTDIAEIRAGVIAAKENSNLPVFCSLTFGEDGKMLLGTDPMTAVHMLEGLGVDAIGLNCSLGPTEMIPLFEKIRSETDLPVIVQPNAGMPEIKNGETIFPVSIKEYETAMRRMLKNGARIVGGCCGTDTRHIASLKKIIKGATSPNKKNCANDLPICCSNTKTVKLGTEIKILAERINPTGKKLLQKALKEKDFGYISKMAIDQVNAGADIININVGMPEINECEMLQEVVSYVATKITTPIMIDSKNVVAIEKTVREHSGRLIINSVSGEKSSLKSILPIAKKYGTPLIALLLDDKGIPKTVNGRLKVLDKIIMECKKFGIPKHNLIVDALCLSASAEQDQARETLETIKIITEKYKLRTTLGASNISFGLPNRDAMNTNFLSIASFFGLSTPITDPLKAEYILALKSGQTLNGTDKNAKNYIQFSNNYSVVSSNISKITDDKTEKKLNTDEELLSNSIIKGLEKEALALTKKLLKKHKPLYIIDNCIVPALEYVGKGYENGTFFLPQMLSASDTVKLVFDYIKVHFPSKKKGAKKTIVLATVKGDIHDIGKNIVASLLTNYGFDVIDLGKDVSARKIIDSAKKNDAKIIGLSALMTTTMVNMEEVIILLKKEKLSHIKVMVGGAVLTQSYAKKIGADFYGKDAMSSVRYAMKIFK